MATLYPAAGQSVQHQHMTEGDISYEPYRHHVQPKQKEKHRVSFQLPDHLTTSLHGLSSKIRHGKNYKPLSDVSRPFWNPFWLSGPSLLLFATWYMLLVIATAALYLFSTRNSGITGESYAHRYSWTYGPTAVLALTLSLWYHVDFWCKELTPWARMRKVATPASHGLLRDYLTKWPLLVLWHAVKAGDHAVWLSTLGTLLLHLATIVSTSIIILQPSAVTSSLKLSTQESFVSSGPNISVQALSGNALVRYFGINARNLTYPVGTSANLTIANFLPAAGYAANSTFSATVPGMSASLDCEPIPSTNLTGVTSQPWESILAPVFTTNISVPSCNLIGIPIGMGISHDPSIVNTVQSFQGWWNNYTCNDGVDNAQYPQISGPPYGYKPLVSGYDDHRLVFVTSFVQWTAQRTMNVSRHTWVQNFTGIICKPRYSIDYYNVRITPADLHTQQPYHAQLQEGTSRGIDGFAGTDLGAMIKRDSVAARVVTAAYRRNPIALVNEDRGYLRTEDPFFVAISGGDTTSAISNQTEMLRRIPEAFSGIAAQAFQEYFTAPGQRELNGLVEVYEARLKAKGLPVGLMLGFLSVLVIISILLVFLNPWDCVPSDPQSIGAKAKFVASSPALSYHLRALNGITLHDVQARMASRNYKTIPAPENREFVIVPETEPLVSGSIANDRIEPQAGSKIWWRPLNHRLWFVLALVLSPLAVIAVLEVLQHISNTRDGLRDVTNIGTRQILVTLIPATILSIIALTFQGAHLNACVTAPFNALKHGGASHSRGLTVSMLGKTSPHVLILGLKHKLLLPCLTAVCVMVGAFLTIVVSGLYYVQEVPLVEQVMLQRADTFNFTKQDLSTSDNLAAVTTKLLFRENLTDSPFTYQDLVFPALNMTNLPFQINGSSVDVRLPAIRPTLRCFENNADDIVYDEMITYSNVTQAVANYQTSFNFPCPTNSSSCSTIWDFPQQIDPNSSIATLGYADDLTSIQCPGQEEENWYYAVQRGCPSLIFALGNTTLTPLNETAVQQAQPSIHAFICYAYLEEVQTNLTLILPEYAISRVAGKLPITDETTARNLTFKSPVYNGPIYGNALSTLMTALGGRSVQVDPFIDTLVQGTDNATATDFLGAQAATTLKDRATRLYATYMVNAISANFRVDTAAQVNQQEDTTQSMFADMLPGTTYNGVLTQTNRKRLQQDGNTKIALQVMLGVMAFVAVTVYLLTDRKLRLPTNPCSIAGTMLLLAGSEMASRNIVPEGSEWSNDTRIWEGWLFSLGWWSDGHGKRFGIDIGNASDRSIGTSHDAPRNDLTASSDQYGRKPALSSSSLSSNRAKPATTYRSTDEVGGEEHELKNLQPFASELVVNVSPGGMGWDDEYRHSQHDSVTTSHPFERGRQQQREVDPGDIGVAQTTNAPELHFDGMYDRYRSRYSEQYQTRK